MERFIKKAVAGVALALVASLGACKDEVTGSSVDSIVFPDANVSYSQHVQVLFQQACAVGGCHAGSGAQAGLNLSPPSYNNLMNHVPRLVTSGSSNNSLLIQRLDGRIEPRMPLNGTPLKSNHLNGIKKWIDEGALNN
ncbi:MAG: hypothetical protein WD182_00465 [Bacteroidota bacterium]